MYIIPFLLPKAKHVKSFNKYRQDIDNSGFPNDPKSIDFLYSKL